MSKKTDPNKKHYFQPSSIEEFAEKLLIHCKNQNALPLTVWEKGEEENQAEFYNAVEYNSSTKTIKLSPTGNLLNKLAGSNKVGKTVLLKLCIEQRLNFFTGGVLTFNAKEMTYSLLIQQDIFKSRQREAFRLESNPSIQIQFKIDNQVFDAIDISTGGTSFIISERDEKRFAKGKIFEDCSLRFDRINYYIPKALVTILTPLSVGAVKANGQYKVGISFQNLPRGVQEELFVKISIEARGHEMKQKFDLLFSKKAEST